MVSNIIIDSLATNISELTKGRNLFAEEGKGTNEAKQVVVSCTSTVPQILSIPIQRITNVNAQLVGYNVEKGYALAETIHTIIQAMSGDYTHRQKDGTEEAYTIDSISVLTHPVLIRKDNIRVVSMNYEIHYKITIS